MKGSWLLARRELGAYLHAPLGWIIIAFVLALDGVLFNAFAMAGQRSTSEVLYQLFYFQAGTAMTAAVFVAMRTFAAERERRTLTLLTTSPLSEGQVVLGKFLGAYAFVALLVLLTTYMPLLVAVNGDVAWGQVASGYLGLLLLSGTATAIGVFASSVAPNQVLAGFLGGGLVVFFLTTWFLAKETDPPLSSVFSYMALFNKHYRPFIEGAVHLRGVIFYGSMMVLFLVGSVRVLEARRWR